MGLALFVIALALKLSNAQSPSNAIGPEAQCLATVAYKGEGRFQWGQIEGTCPEVRKDIGVCEGEPPRECLLSRVPWQTHMSVVQCCFKCCVEYWQTHLGLRDVFKFWFDNPTFRGCSFENYWSKQHPGLDRMLMTPNMVKRFSLFMWVLNHGKPVGIFNATQIVAHLGGGGVQYAHGPLENLFEEDVVRKYLNAHAVSAMIVQDQDFVPWGPVLQVMQKFPHGGHFYTANGGDDESPFIRSIPQGALFPGFEDQLVKLGPATNRSNLLMCCCMNFRRGRIDRVSGRIDLILNFKGPKTLIVLLFPSPPLQIL